jgi:hypothetical protein
MSTPGISYQACKWPGPRALDPREGLQELAGYPDYSKEIIIIIDTKKQYLKALLKITYVFLISFLRLLGYKSVESWIFLESME